MREKLISSRTTQGSNDSFRIDIYRRTNPLINIRSLFQKQRIISLPIVVLKNGDTHIHPDIKLKTDQRVVMCGKDEKIIYSSES